MLKGFLKYHEADAENDPQGGASKVRASELRAQLGTQVDETALMRLLEKQAELLTDNSQLREQRRTLRAEVTELKSKAPADGTRVLSADEAQAYDAYAALGLKPTDLKKALDEGTTVKQELASVRRGETLRSAAEAHGYKPAALAKLPSLKDQDITFKDVDEKGADGKPVKAKRAFVGDVSLPDYIQQNDAEFLPALTDAPKPSGDGVGSPAGGRRPAPSDTQVRSPGIVI
jgi:hypothetical protein